ncbi:MAG: DUF739 family protein [Ruminococcaceae bacterium]|nr:DUF739 family protein [Oscillospiraceae bacterium]
MPVYDYSKLIGRIREYGYTQESFSKALGMSETTLNFKLKSKRSFKQEEILRMSDLLDIKCDEIVPYFFTHKL